MILQEVICLEPCHLTMFISALSCAIAENFSDEELAILAAALTQLADSLALIAAKRTLLD